MLKSKTLLFKSLAYTSVALACSASSYLLIHYTGNKEIANMSLVYGFGMISMGQFVLHFFHRKKGHNDDDLDF